MPRITVTASDDVPAPSASVYAVLADYREGHPAILPKYNFPWLIVEEGGVGAGTVIRFAFRLPGARRLVRAAVTEPEPGRLLAERDLESGALTTFRVEPSPDGRESRVTIGTTWERAGLAGWIERLLAPSFLQRVYAEELANLSVYCRLRFPPTGEHVAVGPSGNGSG